jgi:hypothetical protein
MTKLQEYHRVVSAMQITNESFDAACAIVAKYTHEGDVSRKGDVLAIESKLDVVLNHITHNLQCVAGLNDWLVDWNDTYSVVSDEAFKADFIEIVRTAS